MRRLLRVLPETSTSLKEINQNSSLRKYFFSILLTFIIIPSFGQYVFPDDAEGFLKMADQMMHNTKKDRSIRVYEDFSSVWSNLSEANRKKIIKISQEMSKRHLRPSTNFTDFFASIAYGSLKRNLSSSDIDSLLYVVEKVLENWDSKAGNHFFATTALFLENAQFYASSYNQLDVTGGTIKFKYIEAVPETSPIDIYDQALQQTGNEESQQQAEATDGWGDPNDHFDDWDNQDQVEDSWNGSWDSGSGWETSEQTETTAPAPETPVQSSTSNLFDVGYTAPPQPPVEGAVLEIEGTTLTMITDHDSASIKNTSGSLMLQTGVFVGNGGTFDWTSAGFAPEEVFVELKDYNFDIKSPKLSAEPVLLHYPEKTDSIVEGVFSFQSKKSSAPEYSQYPRFKSFASNVPVKGLGETVEYFGGFSLEGRRLYSSSIDDGKSKILIKHNGEVKVKAVGNRFELGDSLITGNIANIVIYQGKDSIFHPGAILNYKKPTSTLRLTKTSAYRQTPFIDTYHNMEITVDALIWNLDSSNIQFSITNARSEIPAIFESKEFFEADKYSRLQGIYRFHPLQMIVGYAEQEKIKTRDTTYPTIVVSDIASKFNIHEQTLRGAMLHLMKLGYIDYEPRSGEIKLREKAIHYVLSRRDKKDYDNLYFTSLDPSGNNATLDLNNRDLTVRGVDKVRIMDSLNIFIIPESKTLIIKGDRGFEFDGKINTANFQFIGKKFQFNYDSFLVHLPEIDQIRLAAVDPNEKATKDEKKARVLGNELRYSSGTLYLNKPDNKSGRVNYPEYPIFDASKGASVYFDKQDIAGGVYDTTIKFKIPPFTVDSLASNDPQTIGFDGEFESGGIFPNFKTKLVVMPDFSLGFEYDVPQEGFQLYEGKGKYYNKITMDNRGLVGNGRIEFLNTTCYSKEFYFFSDSVLTIGTNADTKPGHNKEIATDVTFPLFTLEEYEMNWKPKADSMNITNMSSPFQLYNKTATLNGTGIITEKGMLGSGVLETRGSVSASNKFHFEEKKYEGHNTTFTVRSDNPSKPAFRSTDCYLVFELEKGQATFSPEFSGMANTEFPYLKYKTSIEKGVWDMNAQKVLLETEGDDISNSFFYSTHPNQDSLVFHAKAGIYDMNTLSLNIEGVPYIIVMDGKIYPDSNKVTIHENAVMETLENVKAEFDTINAYHKLYDGTFDIRGRYRLKGSATYSYTNSSGDNYSFLFKNYNFKPKEVLDKNSKKKTIDTEKEDIQSLLNQSLDSISAQADREFEEMQRQQQLEQQQKSTKQNHKHSKSRKNKKHKKDKKSKSTESAETATADSLKRREPVLPVQITLHRDLPNYHTVAVGLIYPIDSIELAKKILYKGKVTMYSDVKDLYFDGFVKLDLKGALSYSQWLAFNNNGDNSDVKIILENPRADNGNPLTTGLYINKDFNLYPNFISEKEAPDDFEVFSTKGVLKFSSDPDSSQFTIASENKFQHPDTEAGNILTYDDNKSTIECSGKFSFVKDYKGLTLTSSGSAKVEIDSGFYNFNTMMVFNFDMHKTIYDGIAENLKVVADIIPPDSIEMIQDYNILASMEAWRQAKILELAGTKDFQNARLKGALETMPLYEVSNVFKNGIAISNCDLKWSNQYKAFYSVGKIQVANVAEHSINRVMNGYIEIRKTLSGEVVTLLLQPTENNWYFFTYDDNRVAVLSSSDEVNALIAKRSKGEMPTRDKLFFVEADLMEKGNFLSSFKEKYLGITEGGFQMERAPAEEVPVEELNIEEEPEPEYNDQEEPVYEEVPEQFKKKQGKVIQEPELNREIKQHDIEEKKQLQQDQQKMKDLFK